VTTSHRDEFIAARGARWITVAFVAVGILNYGYALVLTRLLHVDAYARFGAGQGLLLWAMAVATVSVPWILAQSLARARSAADRTAAVRFALLTSLGCGIIAAAVIGLITAQFAALPATLALAASTFVLFLGMPTMGWLQGNGRMRTLSVLTVGESLVKVASGLLLVVAAGLADAGALAGFGIGGLLLLAWLPPLPRAAGQPWRASLASRDLWHRALGIAGVQGLVTVLTVIDVVLVTMLPASRAAAASYQASAAVSRVTVFVASAVGTAFFPSLSKRAAGAGLGNQAMRMYATVALPLTVILVTVPAPVLAVAFPPQYSEMATLIRFTALAGLAVGGLNLLTTFFQAVADYSCLWWQGAGLIGYSAALLAGWWAGGVTGLAIGSAAGACAALALVGYWFVHRQGRAVFARFRLVEPIVATVMLVSLRPFPVAWLVIATGVGSLAAVRFLRRSGSPGETGQDRRRADSGGNQ
jgi:O-antigen/teichoic acid export membrane protein